MSAFLREKSGILRSAVVVFLIVSSGLVIRSTETGQVWLDDIEVKSLGSDAFDEAAGLSRPRAGQSTGPSQATGSVRSLIGRYQLDPDYVPFEGPLYIRLPQGRLVFHRQLLAFGPEPFGMTVELTSQRSSSNDLAPDWTVTGRGWDQPLPGWKVEFDEAGQRRQISPDGHWIQCYSTPAGVIQSVSSSAGFGWKLELDKQGGIAAIRDTLGRCVKFITGANRRLVAVTGPADEKWLFAYDGSGKLVQASSRHPSDSARFGYYPDGRARVLEGQERLELDYVDQGNRLLVDVFGRVDSANVFKFAKDGSSIVVGVHEGPHVEYRFDSAGDLTEIRDTFGRSEKRHASKTKSQSMYDTLIDTIIRIKNGTLLEYLDRRANRLGERLMDNVSETVRRTTDGATGRANEAVDASPRQLADFQQRRQEAVRLAEQWIREAVNPIVGPIYSAAEIASNPDDQRQLQALAGWIDSQANSVLDTLLDQAQSATRDDVVQRVRDRLRQPLYDRLRQLPARLQSAIRGSIDLGVGWAVDRTSQSVRQSPPIPESPHVAELTDAEIERALLKAFQTMRIQPYRLVGPIAIVPGRRSFEIGQPTPGPGTAKILFGIALHRFDSGDDAGRHVRTATSGLSLAPDRVPAPVARVIRKGPHDVYATLHRPALHTPATENRRETWWLGSCNYRWLLDDHTAVDFNVTLWPGRGRPNWAGWSTSDYLQRTRPFQAAAAGILDRELKRGKP